MTLTSMTNWPRCLSTHGFLLVSRWHSARGLVVFGWRPTSGDGPPGAIRLAKRFVPGSSFGGIPFFLEDEDSGLLEENATYFWWEKRFVDCVSRVWWGKGDVKRIFEFCYDWKWVRQVAKGRILERAYI